MNLKLPVQNPARPIRSAQQGEVPRAFDVIPGTGQTNRLQRIPMDTQSTYRRRRAKKKALYDKMPFCRVHLSTRRGRTSQSTHPNFPLIDWLRGRKKGRFEANQNQFSANYQINGLYTTPQRNGLRGHSCPMKIVFCGQPGRRLIC